LLNIPDKSAFSAIRPSQKSPLGMSWEDFLQEVGGAEVTAPYQAWLAKW
jgi:hypothetical protein